MELELASGSNFALITLLTPQFFNPPPLRALPLIH